MVGRAEIENRRRQLEWTVGRANAVGQADIQHGKIVRHLATHVDQLHFHVSGHADVIGTIEPRKDHASLVRAMAAIWPILPDLRLVIAGASGWGRHELDAVVAELGVADRIQVLGYVGETAKADLLRGAEVVAYPSLYEGFGLPILEAMQAGVPVVSTTAGAIPEVAGRAAILVEPRDPSALAGALLSVLEDDGLRAQLAEAGRRRVGGFSWETTVEDLVATYRSLTGDREPTVSGRA